jgi:hypothetical protein
MADPLTAPLPVWAPEGPPTVAEGAWPSVAHSSSPKAPGSEPQPGRDPIAQVGAELFVAQRNSGAQAWDPIAHSFSFGALKAAAQFFRHVASVRPRTSAPTFVFKPVSSLQDFFDS